ncbi:hypothetical protein [Phascolarctobacterium sp.]
MEDVNNTAANDNTNGAEAVEQQQEAQQETQPAGTLLGGNQQQNSDEPITYDFKETISAMEDFEFSQEESDKFVEVIKDMGINNEQANAIVKYGGEWGKGIADAAMNAVMEQRNAEVEGWGEAAKKELGTEFDSTISLCGLAVEHVEKVVPGIRQALNETGAGNRIEVIRAFSMLGKFLESDPGKGAGAPIAQGNSLDKFYDKSDFSKLK